MNAESQEILALICTPPGHPTGPRPTAALLGTFTIAQIVRPSGPGGAAAPSPAPRAA